MISSIYKVLSTLIAALIIAAVVPNGSHAEEYDPYGSSAGQDSSAPSLAFDSHAFALETPAEFGARPIPSPYVLPMPRPVAPFPIRLNQQVRRYMSDLLNAPDHLQNSFDRSQPYMPEMVKVLRSYGLPDDLVYLAFAESEFSPNGRGPWQLNSNTARRFGLHIDRYVDERRDPVMSTKAAAEYLATLHDAAGDDWPVTLVAWNNGDTAIDRYWSLRGPNFEKFGNRLPRRTRGLLGRFMAVAYIANHANSYGLTSVKLDIPAPYQTLRVRGGTPLGRIALDHGTTLQRLRDLNPALLHDVVPPSVPSYSVRVPVEDRASAARRLHF